MNKRRILWLIAGLYLCLAIAGFTICWITNQMNNEFIYLVDLKAVVRIISWTLFAMIVVLVLLTWEILSTAKKQIISNQNQETVDSSLEVNSEEEVTEQVIEVQEEKAKKEIMRIYLSSGESFFHKIDSMKLGSKETIDRWKNMPLGGELIVEDSEGW